MTAYTCYHCGNAITGNAYMTSEDSAFGLCDSCFYTEAANTGNIGVMIAELRRLRAIEARLLARYHHYETADQYEWEYQDALITEMLGYTPTGKESKR